MPIEISSSKYRAACVWVVQLPPEHERSAYDFRNIYKINSRITVMNFQFCHCSSHSAQHLESWELHGLPYGRFTKLQPTCEHPICIETNFIAIYEHNNVSALIYPKFFSRVESFRKPFQIMWMMNARNTTQVQLWVVKCALLVSLLITDVGDSWLPQGIESSKTK